MFHRPAGGLLGGLLCGVRGALARALEPDVSGRGSVVRNSLTAAQLATRELDRLKLGVAAFDDPATPYTSWVAPQFMGNFGGNYDHLARVWEWHVVGGEDEAPE